MNTTKSEAKSDIFAIVCRQSLEERGELQNLVQDINADFKYLSSYRNDLAHGRWFAPSAQGMPPIGMRGFKSTARKYDLSQIDQKIEEVSVLTNKIAWLLFQTLAIVYSGLKIDGPSPFEGKFQIGVRLDPSQQQSTGRRAKGGAPPSA